MRKKSGSKKLFRIFKDKTKGKFEKNREE
jgi:type IV secretory pathway VirB4 component